MIEYYDKNNELTENKEEACSVYEVDTEALGFDIGGVFAMAMGASKLVACKQPGEELNVEMFEEL